MQVIAVILFNNLLSAGLFLSGATAVFYLKRSHKSSKNGSVTTSSLRQYIFLSINQIPEKAKYLFLSLLFLIGNEIAAQTTQVFTNVGTFTFTVPAGVTLIKVQCWGGGGGGGYGGSNGNGMNGGGGGAYASKDLLVTPTSQYTITVGAGGSGGTSSTSGTQGSNSSFGNLIIAVGGGVSNAQNTAALGGAASLSTGDIKYSGGNGGKGNTSTNGGGGGGGSSASSTANGIAGITSTSQTGGTGGNGPDGDGGNGGNHSGNQAAVGTAPGGGGGGRGDANGNSASGGKGKVVISWNLCASGNPVPTASISANYCLIPGYIRLTANGGAVGDTYLWNTNETTSTIDVNIAGRYSVTITNTYGCSSTASYDISTELVVDGSFTNFNASSPSFTAEYIQQQSYYIVNNVN